MFLWVRHKVVSIILYLSIVPLYRGIFVKVMTMGKKQILARVLEFKKKMWVTMHFSEIIKQP